MTTRSLRWSPTPPPYRSETASRTLVTSFMTLMDTDDFAAAGSEAGRILRPGGQYCIAIVHPLAESGCFLEDGSFLVDRPYLQVWRYPDELHREGIEMTFHTEHRASAGRRRTRDRSDQGTYA